MHFSKLKELLSFTKIKSNIIFKKYKDFILIMYIISINFVIHFKSNYLSKYDIVYLILFLFIFVVSQIILTQGYLKGVRMMGYLKSCFHVIGNSR